MELSLSLSVLAAPEEAGRRGKSGTPHMQAALSHQEILFSPRQSKSMRGEKRQRALATNGYHMVCFKTEKLFAGFR